VYTLLLGAVGRDERIRKDFNDLKTRISSSCPFSQCECFQRLRGLLQPQGWQYAEQIFLQIIENLTKLHLLDVFVHTGYWDKFESMKIPKEPKDGTVDDFVNALEPVSLRLAARDKIRECHQWEASLTPTMKAARRGDSLAFNSYVKANRRVLAETDLRGNDVWFWAASAGNTAILNYLLNESGVLPRLLSELLST